MIQSSKGRNRSTHAPTSASTGISNARLGQAYTQRRHPRQCLFRTGALPLSEIALFGHARTHALQPSQRPEHTKECAIVFLPINLYIKARILSPREAPFIGRVCDSKMYRCRRSLLFRISVLLLKPVVKIHSGQGEKPGYSPVVEGVNE